MSHDTSAVLSGEAESPSRVVALRTSAGEILHREGDADADAEAGQREALPTPSSPCVAPGSSSIASSVQQHSHPHAFAAAGGSPDAPSIFSAVSDLAAYAADPHSHSIVTPPTQITLRSPRDVLDSQASHSYATNATAALVLPTTIEHPISTESTSAESLQPVLVSNDGAADIEAPKEDKMIVKRTTTNSIQRRRNYATTNALTDYEADLTSRDRAKQKEAVKKYLAERVKDDWKWEWPEAGGEAPLDPAKIIEGDPEMVVIAWKQRDEWLSNASEDGDDMKMPIPGARNSSHDTPTPTSKKSSDPFSDGVGDPSKKTLSSRRRRRLRRLAEEMDWNEGLECFVTRRDAWTCARKVTRSPGTAAIKTPTRASMSSGDRGSSTALEDDEQWEDCVEIPIAPPILPPENAMRASILPGAYNTIYDKVVVQSLTPSCPMNLKDVTRSCVQGWKRDGEWPPKAPLPDTLKKKPRKISVASLLGFKEQDKQPQDQTINGNGVAREAGREEKKSGSGIRRSIQKMLNWFKPALTFAKEPSNHDPPKGK